MAAKLTQLAQKVVILQHVQWYLPFMGPTVFGILDVLAYLRVALINRKFVHDKVKRRLYSRNSCYCLVQNLLSSWFLSNNMKIKMYG